MSYTTTATATNSTGNTILVESTDNLFSGLPIVFSGVAFGGIIAGAAYYVGTVDYEYNLITVSTLPGGTAFVLTTASGSMTATFEQGGQQIIDTNPPGVPLNTAFNDTNLNFDQVFAAGPVGSNIQIKNNTISSIDTNGNIILKPNGTGVVQTNVNLVPDSTRIRTLGTSSKLWNYVYTQNINVAGIATIANVSISGGNITIPVAGLHIAGGTNGYVLQTDGTGNLTWTAQTGGTGNAAPAGANTQIQYNDAGNLGATAGFTFDNTSNVLTVANVSAGTVYSPNFYGNAVVYANATGYLTNTNLFKYDPDNQTLTVGAVSATGNITGANVISANTFAIAGSSTELGQIEGANTVGFYTSDNTLEYLFEGPNNVTWGFNVGTGGTGFPTLNVQRGDNPSGTIQGQTLLFGDSNQEAIISTPDGVPGNEYSQRLVINPGAGYDYGEGGDIYLWAGRGGDNNGSGGDVKIRGGQGMGNTGSGGYIRMEGGDSQDRGYPGYINITAGYGANTYGAYVQVTGGGGGNGQGGPVEIQGGFGAAGFKGGDANIIGGSSADGASNYGNVNINSGGQTWAFDNTGNLVIGHGSRITEVASPVPGNYALALSGTGVIDPDQQLLIYPTSLDANHLHLTSGNLYNTELFLGDDNLYVKLANTGNVVVNSNDAVGNTAQWTFGTDSALTLPASSGQIGRSGYPNGIDLYNNNGGTGYVRMNYADESLISVDSGGAHVQTTGGTWDFDTTGNLTAPGNINFTNNAAIQLNPGTGVTIYGNSIDQATALTLNNSGDAALWANANVTINSDSQGSNPQWIFDNTGNLTAPGNISAVGNITGGNIVTSGSGGDITLTGGNILGAGNISAAGNITGAYLFGNGSQLTGITASVPSQTILPTIQTITVEARPAGLFSGGQGGANVTVANVIPVTEYGVIITDGTTSEKYKTGSLGSIPGTVSLTFTTGLNSAQFTVFAYVTSNAGTYYSNAATGTSGICLLAGTQIALSDGTRKAIEHITYTDKMLSWDFDRGCYAETTAMWIKRGETGSQYNLLTFSDGTTLRTFDQHRIFNKQAGAFTYPMTDATPVGTVTVNEHGQEITLTNKQVIVDTIEYYNVITDHHMNLFSDTVLTSCRFNNIYPITDMKFVKDGRKLRTRDEFENIPDRFFYGLRLAEQTTDIETVEWYVNRLLSTEVSTESELTV